ncbi:zinc/iron permease [Thermoclostridium stercorarium subsp. leptospartum DSM 9219]|jgi:Predicted divalent heavy-metal cations transporter|uniref:Zinc/iron permease n=1 Tax=Thermoclostridium stercorarium subsp. leptospartum DSM 9219 TaxID=1346611 RepID=A0A1B1YLY9_THEST|nr:zinc/iron permease [Thermoclostridium stercorarium subsp. leptospartum DSM 9219]
MPVKDINTFIFISAFAMGAMIVNSLGIWTLYKNREWAEKIKDYCMCFAAGILISSPLIMTLPQAIQKTSYAGFTALAGFLFMYFSNEIIKYKTKQKELAFGITAIEGILIHSLIDGVVYTVTFSISTVVGILTGVGLVVHEFAEGVITFSMLLKGGYSTRKAGIYAFLAAALTTPIGAFIAYPIVQHLSNNVLGHMLGFVAGVLIYVSASHLLPEARDYEKKHSTLAFILGIVFALLIMFTEH